jgi:Flp pilus assembly pilin Flp
MNAINKNNVLRGFHEDEDGMEAVQVIMIVAIAAVVLAALKMAWPSIKQWFSGAVSNITGWNS